MPTDHLNQVRFEAAGAGRMEDMWDRTPWIYITATDGTRDLRFQRDSFQDFQLCSVLKKVYGRVERFPRDVQKRKYLMSIKTEGNPTKLLKFYEE